MKTGKVKWFSDAKGYGFIEVTEAETYSFITAIDKDGYRTLTEGQDVEFDIIDGAKALKPRTSTLS